MQGKTSTRKGEQAHGSVGHSRMGSPACTTQYMTKAVLTGSTREVDARTRQLPLHPQLQSIQYNRTGEHFQHSGLESGAQLPELWRGIAWLYSFT